MKINFHFLYLSIATIKSTYSSPRVAPVDCVDSTLTAILDELFFYPLEENITCAGLASFEISETRLSFACSGQNLLEHCPVTCQSCDSFLCDDSTKLFQVNGDEKRCVDVASDPTMCDILGVRETCRRTCDYCPTAAPSISSVPSVTPLELVVEELASKLEVLEGTVEALETTIDEQEDNIDALEGTVEVLETTINEQEEVIDRLVANECTYVAGYGCFPSTLRDGEVMVYVNNEIFQNWNEHNENAISCGGRLADIYDETENYKASVVFGPNIPHFIGGIQTCDDEPAGCWEWSDGSDIIYTNWNDGEPNDLYGGDCLEIDPSSAYQYDRSTWNDRNCNEGVPAVYLLPTTFNTLAGCSITVEAE